MKIKDYDEACSLRRHNDNEGLMKTVAQAIKHSPRRTEDIETNTGLSHEAVILGLNLLHTKSRVALQGGMWFSQTEAA